jgi:hypothetical protein
VAFSSYTDLQASIRSWLNRDELTSEIPDFIVLCEAKLRRRLRAKQVRVRSSILLGPTGEYILPAGVKEVSSLYLNGADLKGELRLTTPERVNLIRAQWGPSGIPTVFAVVDGTLLLGPVPDTSYDAEIIWDAEITPLSASAPTNWLLTDYPDIYLYGSLMHSAPFLRDDERLTEWEGLLNTALDELEKARDSAEYGGNTPIVRPKNPLGE